VEDQRPTARPAHIVRLAEHLTTAQDMADRHQYPAAFGYLEQAVSIMLAFYDTGELTQVVVGAREARVATNHGYDAADVWKGVVSHPLF
jgi:hypothetical protein